MVRSTDTWVRFGEGNWTGCSGRLMRDESLERVLAALANTLPHRVSVWLAADPHRPLGQCRRGYRDVTAAAVRTAAN